MRRPLSAHAEILATVVFWAGNFSASKIALATIPPLAFVAIRFAIGTLLIWIILLRVEPGHRLPRELRGTVVWLGLVGNTLYQLCFINGLARTSATNTALILAAMPTVVTVTGGLLGMERVDWRQAMALALATLGVVLVIAPGDGGRGGDDLVGDLLVLGGVGFWTAYTLGLRRVGARLSPLAVTAWALLTGTPALILIGAPALASLDFAAPTPAAWSGLAYSTVFSLVVAYVFWSMAVHRIGAARSALYTCLTPLLAAVIAGMLLGERPTLWHLLGAPLIIGGVLLGNARRGGAPAEG